MLAINVFEFKKHLGLACHCMKLNGGALLWEQATSWKLEEAIQLFFVVDEGGPIVASSQSPASENVNYLADQNTG